MQIYNSNVAKDINGHILIKTGRRKDVKNVLNIVNK